MDHDHSSANHPEGRQPKSRTQPFRLTRRRILCLSWPAHAILTYALSLTGLFFLRAKVTGQPVLGQPVLWALSFFLFATAGFLALVDRRTQGDRPVWVLALGAEWDAEDGQERSIPRGLRASVKGAIGAVRRTLLRAPFRSATMFLALLLGAAVVLELQRRADRVGEYWDLMALWLVSVVLYLLALIRTGPRSEGAVVAWLREHRVAIADVCLLWVAGAALRLPGLGEWTPVINGDEGIVGNVASALAEGGTPFGTQFALGSLYYLLHTPFVLVFDGGIASLRTADALIGTLTAPALYLAGRELFGRRVGLVAGVLMAAQHMHVHFSRVALGQALDASLMALVLVAFMRGLEKREPFMMAVAGVGLGLSQYGYVGGRSLGLVFAAFAVLLVVLQPRYVARRLREICAAAGAAVLVALPMARWALVRPGDYLSRVQAMGFAQTGGASWQASATGSPEWLVWLGQLRDAFLALLAHPARFFYDATMPMLSPLYGALFVLGLGYAVWRIRDRRMMPLIVAVVGALLALALGQDTASAAYRVLGALPVFVLIAAVSLVLLASGAVAGTRRTRSLATAVIALTVAALVVFDLRYYCLQHIPACRYTDPGSAGASLAGEYIGTLSPETTVFALTGPELILHSYPSVEYLSGREVLDLSLFPGHEKGATRSNESGDKPAIYSVPAAFGDLTPLLQDSAPAVAIASQDRLAELHELRRRLSRGQLTALVLCGDPTLEVLLVSQ